MSLCDLSATCCVLSTFWISQFFDEPLWFKCDCGFSFYWFHLQFRLFVYVEQLNQLRKTRASNVYCCFVAAVNRHSPEQTITVCQPPAAVLSFLFLPGFSQGTLLPLLHPVGLCDCFKNVPTQSSMTEVGVLVSVIFTKAETMHEVAVYLSRVLSDCCCKKMWFRAWHCIIIIGNVSHDWYTTISANAWTFSYYSPQLFLIFEEIIISIYFV